MEKRIKLWFNFLPILSCFFDKYNGYFQIFTAHKRSLGKGNVLQLSVILSTGSLYDVTSYLPGPMYLWRALCKKRVSV